MKVNFFDTFSRNLNALFSFYLLEIAEYCLAKMAKLLKLSARENKCECRGTRKPRKAVRKNYEPLSYSTKTVDEGPASRQRWNSGET